MMSPPGGGTTLTLNDPKAEEDRMRAALGLTPHAPSSRPAEQSRQSGQDGAAAVTIVSTRRPFEAPDSSRARLAALTDELKAECRERVAAQQALADARQAIQQLQTKLAHTEMAAAEALEAERKARQAAEARLLEIPPRKTAKAAADQPKRRGRPPKQQQTAGEPATPRKPGRPPGKRQAVEELKQEPVQWWLPSYAAATKRRRSKA